LIRERLIELDESQWWLAKQIGKSQPSVYGYASGKTLPKKDTLKKIFEVLELPYETLDDLLD
jgi:predicted transcriptional regulator